MTQLTGCKPSNKEIVDKFDDFITMFPTEDLTVLYDKEGDTSVLPHGDLGTWTISSYLDTEDEESDKTVGVVLKFNRNTRNVEGNFIIAEIKNDGTEIENQYPINYDKDGIHLLDENLGESVKEELTNFNMMYDFITLNKKYLENLRITRYNYNGEVPLYDLTYKLTSDDINIEKIKEIYPDLPVDDDNISLYLEGNESIGRVSSKIYLDSNDYNYFTSAMSFNKSN